MLLYFHIGVTERQLFPSTKKLPIITVILSECVFV